NFFFSSRRRHTRSKRDWSSDVCSSDLGVLGQRPQMAAELGDGDRLGARNVPGFELRARTDVEDDDLASLQPGGQLLAVDDVDARSEERRVGKEGRVGGCQTYRNRDVRE